MASEFDIVIRGGTIMDGNGGAPFVGDVAVKDGTIAAVGKVSGHGREEIDADGLSVTPGFVDIHTHYDGQAMWDSHLAPSSWHGVTTVVMGNCGVGFAPVRKNTQDAVIALMEGVEDIPGPCLHEGLDWSWESFADYLTALERRSHDIDFCALLPHAPMRVYRHGRPRAEPGGCKPGGHRSRCARSPPMRCAPGRSASPRRAPSRTRRWRATTRRRCARRKPSSWGSPWG